MVVAESDMISQAQVDSSTMPDHHHQNPKNNQVHHHTDQQSRQGDNVAHNNGVNNNNNYAFPNLGRQSSIYSLTLDEFQHTLCESGKNFGSMNMDEFLNSIWTAEENQAHHNNNNNNHHSHDQLNNNSANNNTAQFLSSLNASSASAAVAPASSTSRGMNTIAKQPSLGRQGSLSLPAPLCRKTVEEVWSEIQRTQPHDNGEHQQEQDQNENQQQVGNSSTTQRQPTFGEMTLEDFLVKAGVVREQCGPQGMAAVVPQPPPPPTQHQPYGFANPHPQMGPTFNVARPMMPVVPPPPAQHQFCTTRNNGYPTSAVGPSVGCYGGRVNNGGAPGGGFGAGLSPVSPVSPDGMCGAGAVEGAGGGQYGMELAVLRGRKRIIDGPVEKVVERRQRRMIKNRESAARSRARKQAYTVELEAELNQLREENAQLKQALAEIERQRKQQYLEEQKLVATRAQRAQEKLKTMRRSGSCVL